MEVKKQSCVWRRGLLLREIICYESETRQVYSTTEGGSFLLDFWLTCFS